MWPVTVHVLNYPPKYRGNKELSMIVGVIPYSREKGKKRNWDLFFDFILDEFVELWRGIDVVLPSNLLAKVRGMILFTLTDSRAMPKINQQVQSPAFIGACHECHIVGKKHGDTTVYGNTTGILSPIFNCFIPTSNAF